MGKFRLKELATAKGLTQEQLAQQSGVTISTVRRIWQNKGVDDPRVGTLRPLAQTLGVTVEDLYNPDADRVTGGNISNKPMSLARAGV